jgi:hypothetical protein
MRFVRAAYAVFLAHGSFEHVAHTAVEEVHK